MTDSRWLQDDAVSLQLQEVGGYLAMLNESDDPARLRGWFVALCLFRADKAVKAKLQASLAAAQQAQRGKPSYVWLLVLVGFFYRRQDVGAAGLAILLAACWGLEGDRYPLTYVRFIKWTCSIALLAYAVVLVFDVTGH